MRSLLTEINQLFDIIYFLKKQNNLGLVLNSVSVSLASSAAELAGAGVNIVRRVIKCALKRLAAFCVAAARRFCERAKQSSGGRESFDRRKHICCAPSY